MPKLNFKIGDLVDYIELSDKARRKIVLDLLKICKLHINLFDTMEAIYSNLNPRFEVVNVENKIVVLTPIDSDWNTIKQQIKLNFFAHA